MTVEVVFVYTAFSGEFIIKKLTLKGIRRYLAKRYGKDVSLFKVGSTLWDVIVPYLDTAAGTVERLRYASSKSL